MDRGRGRGGSILHIDIMPAAAQSPLTEPVVSITGGPTVTEGADVTFTLTANPAPAADITVKVNVTKGYFSRTPDGQLGLSTVTIGTGSFTVATVNDGAANAGESHRRPSGDLRHPCRAFLKDLAKLLETSPESLAL